MISIVIGGVVLAPILAFYGLVMLSRRTRLRSAAAALQAAYVDEGWFRPGKIVGSGFTVWIGSVRRSFLTHVEVVGGHAPGPVTIDAGFFDAWPDWRCVHVPQWVRQRVFVAHVMFPGYGPPSDEQRDALQRWSKDRRLPTEMLASAKVTRIEVSDGGVSTTFRGIVTDATRLQRTLDLLRRLASDGGA